MNFNLLQLQLTEESYNKVLCKPVITSKHAGKKEYFEQLVVSGVTRTVSRIFLLMDSWMEIETDGRKREYVRQFNIYIITTKRIY